MSEQSAVVVENEVNAGPPWLTTVRDITITIDSTNKKMKISHPDRHIGEGNLVRWEVGTIPGYKVEIRLSSPASPASLLQGAGTKVQGNIRSALHASATYTVFLTDGRVSHQLQHVDSLGTTRSPLPDPTLMIDRMGDPP